MIFRLYLDVDNDAFQPLPYAETARILRAIADRIESAGPPKLETEALGDYADGGGAMHYQTIRDVNGNDVGRYAFKPDSEKYKR